MKLNERITLAKAGYKKADIEKMLEQEKITNFSENSEKEENEEVKNDVIEEDNNDVIEDDKQENNDDEILEDNIKDNIIEELQSKVLNLEKQLKNAQSVNINTDRKIENPIEKAESKLFDTIANFNR